MLAFSRFASLKCSTARRCARHLVTDASAVRDQLRALLRDTAQPVAVVTALMDPSIAAFHPHPHLPSNPSRGKSKFHGATLSSFSSIAMDPHPLVAFSLRIPSRMATALASAHNSASASTPAAHMVINILSERQASTAVRFSRPDLHAEPFAGLAHTLSHEGLPVLDGSVGALSCRLVAASWPLHDLESLTEGGGAGKDGKEWEGEGVVSELFIAQVVRVERTLPEGEEARPLLYHRRGYVTTQPIESAHSTKPSG
ncbi:flavin reductase like domain-containing protein [Cerioporus squamosus]|nr:flavin reductase like domain-containing protein [Cerioporus squamosus]